MDTSEAFLAASLIQWGLRASQRPFHDREYRELLDRYQQEPAFRAVVRDVARGLGLDLIEVTDLGIVLAPVGDSVFAFRAADFRQNAGADARLLDGLVQLAIATTVFPHARDLQEDPTVARQPVTVEDVEDRLRSMCDRMHEEAQAQPDPELGDAAPAYEAWRVFRSRPSTRETPDNRQGSQSTRRIIQFNLDRLADFGCFRREAAGDQTTYHPTWRYQVQVQELAAMAIFEQAQRWCRPACQAKPGSGPKGS